MPRCSRTDGRVRVLGSSRPTAGSSYPFLPDRRDRDRAGHDAVPGEPALPDPRARLAAVLLPIVVRLQRPRALRLSAPVLLACCSGRATRAVAVAGADRPPRSVRRRLRGGRAARVAGAHACGGRRPARGTHGHIEPCRGWASAPARIGRVTASSVTTSNAATSSATLQNPPLGAVDRWAQGSRDTRIGLYGSVEQYPLYGARDTDAVDYLGARSADGRLSPDRQLRGVAGSPGARATTRYVGADPRPHRAGSPLAWTAGDPRRILLLHPSTGLLRLQRWQLASRSAECS